MTQRRRTARLPALPKAGWADADLRPLFVLATLIWLITLSLQLALSEQPATWRSAFREVMSGTASAAFGVLVAGLLFDRLRRQAERAAERRTAEELRRLWVDEYSLPYEGLAESVTSGICEVVLLLYRIARVEPVNRALRSRGFDGSFLEMELHSFVAPELELSFVTSPTPSGGATLARLSREVASAAEQLRDGSDPDGHSADLDPGLLGDLVRDFGAAMPALDKAVAGIWRDVLDLRSLHEELMGEGAPPSEASFGSVLIHGVDMRNAVAAIRFELGSRRTGEQFSLVRAQSLLRHAERVTDAASELYTHVSGLQRLLEVTYLQGLSFREGARFLEHMSADHDATVQTVQGLFGQAAAASADGVLVAQAKAARERTFRRVREEELVPEFLRATGDDERS